MKVDVLLRMTPDGVFSAHVIQEGSRGSNLLLGRVVRDIDLAKLLAKHALFAQGKNRVEFEITWKTEA